MEFGVYDNLWKKQVLYVLNNRKAKWILLSGAYIKPSLYRGRLIVPIHAWTSTGMSNNKLSASQVKANENCDLAANEEDGNIRFVHSNVIETVFELLPTDSSERKKEQERPCE